MERRASMGRGGGGQVGFLNLDAIAGGGIGGEGEASGDNIREEVFAYWRRGVDYLRYFSCSCILYTFFVRQILCGPFIPTSAFDDEIVVDWGRYLIAYA